MSAVLIVLAVIVLATIVAVWFPEPTKRWVQNIMFARRIVFGALSIIVAFILIGTGWWPLVLVGAFTFAVAAWIGYFQGYRGEELI